MKSSEEVLITIINKNNYFRCHSSHRHDEQDIFKAMFIETIAQ